MFNPTELTIKTIGESLKAAYRNTYGNLKPECAEMLGWVASVALENLANSNALYHNVEHTVIVTLVGQEILRGKQLREGNVSCEDWLHSIISLLCHDIGYVRGVCRQDRVNDRLFATGLNDEMIFLPACSTDASLTPYHVDRGKMFVDEHFSHDERIDVEAIKHNIELTRFPVPNDEEHQDTVNFSGLVRAADLIGQLSDPRYLDKIPALFYEFEETGVNKNLGYNHPGDLRAGFPNFFWNIVYRYIQEGLRNLEVTYAGQQIIANLKANVFVVEYELLLKNAKLPVIPEEALRDVWWQGRTQHLGENSNPFNRAFPSCVSARIINSRLLS